MSFSMAQEARNERAKMPYNIFFIIVNCQLSIVNLLEVERHPNINRKQINLEIPRRCPPRPFLHLVRLLVRPLEIVTHHADRHLDGGPVRDERRHPRRETDLEIMDCLERPVVCLPRACRVLAPTVAIRQPRLVEEAEYLAASDGDIGAEETRRLVAMLQVIKIVEADVEILAEVQLEILQVEVIALVCKAETRRDIVTEEVADVWADREIVPLSLDILQDKEVQVPLVVLRIRDRPADHPRPLGDKNGLLDLAVDALDGAFPALSLRRADRHGQQEEES